MRRKIIPMTAVEKELLQSSEILLAYLTTPRKIHSYEYTDVLGRVRDMVRTLKAIESGCPIGKHFSYCTCVPGHLGKQDNSI